MFNLQNFECNHVYIQFVIFLSIDVNGQYLLYEQNYYQAIEQNSDMDNNNADHFTTDQLRSIELCLTCRYRVEQLLSKFEYKEDKSHEENIFNLCQGLMNGSELQSQVKSRLFLSFRDFLSLEQNVPIEVNFRNLKFQQLKNLLEQWQMCLQEPSMMRPSQRLYSIQHKNIIFSRVFVEQRQNIEMYFQTISQKKMLKGVDLYQLVVDILSHYYLYEYLGDNETFFEKVNSFNNFLQVVEKFIHSERRIIIDHKSKDFQYVKIYEFEALIHFWESTNPELEVRSDRRFINSTKGVQTQRHEIMQNTDCEVQTVESKDKLMTLEQTINMTLRHLNKLTQEENQAQKLQVIQNICEALRKQKIKLLTLDRNKIHHIRKSQSPQMTSYTNIQGIIAQQASQDLQNKQRQVEFQKTQRIFTKSYMGVEESRDSFKKRKYHEEGHALMQGNQDTLSYKYHRVTVKERIPQKSQQKPLLIYQILDQNQNSSYKYFQGQQTKSQKPVKNQSETDLRQPAIPRQRQSLSNGKTSLKQCKTKYNQSPGDEDQRTMLSLLELIFNHYSDSKSGYIDISILNRFFLEIGIIHQNETKLTFNLFKKNVIKNLNKIRIVEFLQIMDSVMNQDQDLTYEVIAEFVDLYVRSLSKQYSVSSIVEVNSQKRYSRQENSLMPKTQQKDSRRKRFMYCQETPKFQSSISSNGFSEPRNTSPRQNKINVPILNLKKLTPSKYTRY